MTLARLLARIGCAMVLTVGGVAARADESARLAAGDIALVIDFAHVLRVDGEISAVVIGNPEIADAAVTNGSTLVLTGRSAGSTNVIALTEAGQTLTERRIVVASRKPGTVTVRRPDAVSRFSCASGPCDRVALVEQAPSGLPGN